jgi:integrase
MHAGMTDQLDFSAFDRPATAAGLSRITFHDLRHSDATGALKAGISPKVISQRTGHANVGFFLQTYAHVVGNDDWEAAERAAAFLIGGSGTTANTNHDD